MRRTAPLGEKCVGYASDSGKGEAEEAHRKDDLRQFVDPCILPTRQETLKEEDQWGQTAGDQEKLKTLTQARSTWGVLIRHEGLLHWGIEPYGSPATRFRKVTAARRMKQTRAA